MQAQLGSGLMQSAADQYVAFALDEAQYALPLTAVERVIRMVEVTALPGGPEIVTGVISLQGRVIPVLDLRGRFALPPREAHPSDQLIIARTSKWTVSLPVDFVSGVIARSREQVTSVEQLATNMRYVAGVSQLDDRIVLIHDLEQFLSSEEDARLSESLDLE